jgi:phosphatidylglycerol lysyltransferase
VHRAEPPPTDAARARVLACLRRHGWHATSFQALAPGLAYWFEGGDVASDVEACVAYVDTGRAWVVAGAPIAPPDRLAAVTRAFLGAAHRAGRQVSCFAAEAGFHDVVGWAAMRVGDQPIWDPRAWPEVVAASRSLREQLRRARAKGVEVVAVDGAAVADGTPLRAALDELIARWLASRPMAPMGFLVQVAPFVAAAERRYVVARQGERVVGLLVASPIFARAGWFFEHVLRAPDAPNGTSEVLIDLGMREVAAAGAAHVTLGMAPLAGDVGPWLRAARRVGRGLYDFDGLRAFKAKLAPAAWEPLYLAYPPGRTGFGAMRDALTAFARGGLWRFGVETLLRGPAIVMRLLAALLVPWTILLALPSSARFFPGPIWQWGWVAFDVMLCGALYALSRRWHHGLANLVAGAVTADAALTLAQVVAFDLPRQRGAVDVAVCLIAVLAPSAAAVLLWNARAHRRALASPGAATAPGR